jgi:hypothetical protein
MKKLVVSLGVLVLGVYTVPAQAAAYGDAGCGLGSMVFGDSPGFVQVLAATTNGIFANQLFGITSGTSNCGGGGEASAKAKTKSFLETNRQAVAKDIAKGGGETIATLVELAGCKDAAAVGATLQSSYTSIFPDASVSDGQAADAVLQTLEQNPALACGNLG